MPTRLADATPPSLAELRACLRNLRQPWPDRWPGLPRVLDSAWQQLGLGPVRKNTRLAALRAFAQKVAQHAEDHGQRQHALGCEPAYHNRLHIADTLAGITYLLRAARALRVPGADAKPLNAIALAIMAGHDFLHPGGSNARPGQFETQAIADLEPLMRAAGVSPADQALLSHCVLATDPVRVKSFHQSVSARSFDLWEADCLAVLVQEADILASTLPQTQQALTQALATEWAHRQPEAARKLLQPQSRLLFLEHAALFSSPAAHALGLPRVKALQIARLQRALH